MPAMPYLLVPVLCKQAQQTSWDRFTERHPVLSTLGYFNPLTSAATSGMEAINQGRKGNYGRAALNAVWALSSLVPGGAQVMGLTRLARLGRALKGTGKAFIPKAPAAAKSILSMPFAGIRNMFRRGINPIKHVGNEFISGFAGAPGTGAIGSWLDRGSKLGIKGLTRLQGGSKSVYSKVIGKATIPAAGLSMFDTGQDAQPTTEVNTQDSNWLQPNYWNAMKSGSEKQGQTQTFNDIIEAVLNDTSLSHSERSAAITALRRAFPMAGPYTVITPGMAGIAGAAVAWILSRYANMSPPIQALAGIAGFGLGRAIHDNLTNPYKGYRQIG